MKRKLNIEVSQEEEYYNPAKMIKQEPNSNLDVINVIDMHGRNLNFKLTDKTAKKNLLDGAKRIPFERELKQKCIKMKFSSGAYKEVVFPTLISWKTKLNQTFEHKNMMIKVSELKAGYEANSKHFDTKVVFNMEMSRIVIHCYNSTQNIKVEGSGYLKFCDDYLEPMFLESIDRNVTKIQEYDEFIMKSFGPTKPVLRRSTRYKPILHFKCKSSEHTVSLNYSNQSNSMDTLPEIIPYVK